MNFYFGHAIMLVYFAEIRKSLIRENFNFEPAGTQRILSRMSADILCFNEGHLSTYVSTYIDHVHENRMINI